MFTHHSVMFRWTVVRSDDRKRARPKVIEDILVPLRLCTIKTPTRLNPVPRSCSPTRNRVARGVSFGGDGMPITKLVEPWGLSQILDTCVGHVQHFSRTGYCKDGFPFLNPIGRIPHQHDVVSSLDCAV